MGKSWDDMHKEVTAAISKIEAELEANPPKKIYDVLAAVNMVAPSWGALPNNNGEGQYCQVVLYPPSGFSCSLQVAKYDLYM